MNYILANCRMIVDASADCFRGARVDETKSYRRLGARQPAAKASRSEQNQRSPLRILTLTRR